MNNFKFRDFTVYKDACKFRNGIRKIVNKDFPKEESFDLTTQIFRALNSIILNIAEGSDRLTEKDFVYFLNLSQMSLNEVVACLDLAKDDWLIDDNTHQELLKKAEDLADQLSDVREKLIKS